MSHVEASLPLFRHATQGTLFELASNRSSIAGYAKLAHLDESIQFISSMVGIMPLAFLMGKATEEIAQERLNQWVDY